MFLPYRADLEFTRIPVITGLVCLACIAVFLRQQQSYRDITHTAEEYCSQDHPRRFWLTMTKLAGEQADTACPKIMSAIHTSGHPREVINKLAERARPWDLMSAAESRAYTVQQLEHAYDDFKSSVKPSLTERLAYNPASYNVWRMVTAAFAHASWGHIIGNLIFFYAFGATVEIVIGPLAFAAMIFALAIGTHFFYSLSQVMATSPVPTIGLSGVVMGVIGLFAYLAPTARIRCVLWLLVFWRVLRVPAWVLALWYVGWDVYSLTHNDGSSHVNFVAHVSGAALGYLSGLVLFRRCKEWANSHLQIA
jgi:membrane associated rhomboid family serine protease